MSDLHDEETIFAAAIEIDAIEERDRFLREACGDNLHLRVSIEGLIEAYETDRGFLETPAVATAVGVPEEEPGQTIDRYRLVAPIGEGGFGVVWQAVQLRPVKRPVAIKIIRADVATTRFISRFERERQTLALMNHPNIATVHDAGTTPSGHPYFVMELVEGETIDQYCRRKRSTVEDRVRMMIDVCRAVHHAHQKGIVHRDLKPNNILVAEVDGLPRIKMIDFGIAKALRGDPSTTEMAREESGDTGIAQGPASQTVDHLVAGTPHFMSPEQFLGETDIDTVADVYALGGIAYQLMTGFAPFETKQRQTSQALRESVLSPAPPIKPSNRPLQSSGVETTELQGDMDAIILRALNKDRDSRYPSASELADDLQRFLDHQPVIAMGSSGIYVLRKFARRHRALAWTATLALCSILAGIVGISYSLMQARIAQQDAEHQREVAEKRRRQADSERITAETMREVAETESENAKQVVALLQEMLGASDPQRGLPSNYNIREQIDVFATKLKKRTELISSPRVRADLNRTIGRSYLSLQKLPEAKLHLEEALAIRQGLYPADDPRVLESRLDHANYLLFSQQRTELQTELMDLISILKANGPEELLVQALVFSSSNQVWGNRADALEAAGDALEAARRVHGEDHWITLVQQSRVASQVAVINPREDALNEAENLAKDALDNLVSLWPDYQFEIALCRGHLARIQHQLGKNDASEMQYRQAIASFGKQLGPSSHYALRDTVLMAQSVYDQGRPEEAAEIVRSAIELAEQSSGASGRWPSTAFKIMATILEETTPEISEDYLRRAVATHRRSIGDSLILVRQLRTQANALLMDHRFAAVKILLESCVDVHESLGNNNAVQRLRRDLDRLDADPAQFRALIQRRRRAASEENSAVGSDSD